MVDWRDNRGSNQNLDVRERLARVENQTENHEQQLARFENTVTELNKNLTDLTKVLNEMKNADAFRRGGEHQRAIIVGIIASFGGGGLTALIEHFWH